MGFLRITSAAAMLSHSQQLSPRRIGRGIRPEGNPAPFLITPVTPVVVYSRYGSRGFWGEVKSSLLQPDVHLTFMLIYIYMYP